MLMHLVDSLIYFPNFVKEMLQRDITESDMMLQKFQLLCLARSLQQTNQIPNKELVSVHLFADWIHVKKMIEIKGKEP